MKTRFTKTHDPKESVASGLSMGATNPGSHVQSAADGAEATFESKPARQGWAEALDKVSFDDYEMLYDDRMPNKFDEEEWTW